MRCTQATHMSIYYTHTGTALHAVPKRQHTHAHARSRLSEQHTHMQEHAGGAHKHHTHNISTTETRRYTCQADSTHAHMQGYSNNTHRCKNMQCTQAPHINTCVLHYTHTGDTHTCGAKQTAHTRTCKATRTRRTSTALTCNAVPNMQHTHADARTRLPEQYAHMQEHAMHTGTAHTHIYTTRTQAIHIPAVLVRQHTRTCKANPNNTHKCKNMQCTQAPHINTCVLHYTHTGDTHTCGVKQTGHTRTCKATLPEQAEQAPH
jgi:hypothetical protein